MSIIALKNHEIGVVQASMLGSILSNLLLVLGCSFLAGGLRYREQFFNCTMASTMSSLMAVASASLMIPTILYDKDDHCSSEKCQKGSLALSRAAALVLLLLYAMYLLFQLRTHSNLFDEEEQIESEDNGESSKLSVTTAGVILFVVTGLVSVCAHYMIDSINVFVEKTNLSKTFVGLILIPIIGNAAEHATAVIVAWRNNMALAIGVAIGSCLQIALFVTPALVLLGWAMGSPMSLNFEPFETMSFFLSAFVVTLLLQDGKSNYLEGALCLGM